MRKTSLNNKKGGYNIRQRRKTMDINNAVDIIARASYPLEIKLAKLWAITQLDYRGEAGDKAFDQISQLVGPEVSNAIAFLTGFAYGNPTAKDFKRLLPELDY